jgi:hypothetical protein
MLDLEFSHFLPLLLCYWVYALHSFSSLIPTFSMQTYHSLLFALTSRFQLTLLYLASLLPSLLLVWNLLSLMLSILFSFNILWQGLTHTVLTHLIHLRLVVHMRRYGLEFLVYHACLWALMTTSLLHPCLLLLIQTLHAFHQVEVKHWV